jgi:hypothetical protein
MNTINSWKREFITKKGFIYSADGWKVNVVVLNAKSAFGRIDFLVCQLFDDGNYGDKQTWIDSARFYEIN